MRDRFAAWTMWLMAGAAALPGPGRSAETGDETIPPVVTVDDTALRDRFQQALEESIGAPGIPQGAGLLAATRPRSAVARLREIEKQPPPAGPALSSPAIFGRALRGALLVGHLYQCGKCSKWHPNIAGGVTISADGLAVTNYHVMDASKAEIFGAMTYEGEVYPIVEVLAASKSDDLAIVRLKTDGKMLAAIPLAGDDPVGSEVRVVSHPDGRFYTCSEGIVARYFFDPQAKAPRVQITADYAKGSSGSGVFNDRGALVGLVSATTSIYYTQTPEEQKNLQMVVKSCIPVASIRKLLRTPPAPGDREAPKTETRAEAAP